MSIQRALVIGGVGHATASALTAAGARVLVPAASGTPPIPRPSPSSARPTRTSSSRPAGAGQQWPAALRRQRSGAASDGQLACQGGVIRRSAVASLSRCSGCHPPGGRARAAGVARLYPGRPVVPQHRLRASVTDRVRGDVEPKPVGASDLPDRFPVPEPARIRVGRDRACTGPAGDRSRARGARRCADRASRRRTA
jgi:mono/diheme cytochrome c family protein